MNRIAIAAFTGVLSVLALTGCSVMSTTAAPGISTGASIQGIVHGGQQAIAGSHVYLLAANPNHYSTLTQHGSNSLLTAAANTTEDTNSNYYVTTAADGSFNISGDYTCTSGEQVYLYANGGYSDGNPADANAAIGLMAVLGPCPNSGNFATQTPFVWINEVTTVAAAYALSGFAADSDHIGAPSATSTLALTGIQNAFNNAFNLAELSTGTACTHTASTVGGDCITSPNTSGAAPTSTLNTLANILAACVNTTSPTSSNCTTLFENATFTGASTGSLGNEGVNPTDTATAAICMAQHPWANVSNLFGLQAGVAAPFAPNLGATPNDLTLGLTYTGNGISQPTSIAVDASGNIWVTDYNTSQISEFTPQGAVAGSSPFSGNSMDNPDFVAIDTTGNVWVANQSANFISVFTSAGAAATTPASPLSGNGLGSPRSVSIDASGNAWVTNGVGAELSVFTSTGAAATTPASPLSGNSLSGPFDIAFDTSGNAWATNVGLFSNKISVFTSAGVPATTPASPLSGNGLDRPQGVAIDGSGNAWVTDETDGKLSAFTSTGGILSGSPFSGGGLVGAWSLAIDGGNTLWIATGTGSIAEFSNAGTALSPSTGLATSSFGSSGESLQIAIDGSGNVWTADEANSILIELVGAGTPTVTPVVANLKSPYATAAVNKP